MIRLPCGKIVILQYQFLGLVFFFLDFGIRFVDFGEKSEIFSLKSSKIRSKFILDSPVSAFVGFRILAAHIATCTLLNALP